MYLEIINYLFSKGIKQPEIGLVLGSGLGELANEIENPVILPYTDIPNFPVSTVEGHDGNLIFGLLSGKKVIALQGRFHFYEGYALEDVTYPIRVFKELGVKTLILTNAAGGVNQSFEPGDIMVITDHLNLSGCNPLMGPNVSKHGPRFVDLSQTYSLRAQELLKQISLEEGISLKEGVYTWLSGPSYETPAEIRMVRTLGGDAVGMSTVPEAIVAKHTGMEVIGLSCITNLAAGMQDTLSHEEVVTISNQAKPKFKQILRHLIAKL